MATALPAEATVAAEPKDAPPEDAPNNGAAKAAPTRPGRKTQQLMEAQRVQQEACEHQHLQGCGRQISSMRKTQPAPAFGAPSLLPRRQGRCASPRCRSPGPKYCAPATPSSPTLVPKNFGGDRRFLEGLAPGRKGVALIKTSTHASPFSIAYPYEDPPISSARADGPAVDDGGAPLYGASSGAGALQPQPAEPESPRRPRSARARLGAPGWDEAERRKRRCAQTVIDLNKIHLRCSAQPAWTFGSANIGGRYSPGHRPSRTAVSQTTSRVPLFRELRDSMPVKPASAPAQGQER